MTIQVPPPSIQSVRVVCGFCGYEFMTLGMTMEDLNCVKCQEAEAKKKGARP